MSGGLHLMNTLRTIAAASLLRAAKVPTIVFYAREEPSQLASVTKRERYDALRRELRDLVRGELGPKGRYSSAPETIAAERYLDHVHVDAQGYHDYLDHLWPHVEAALSEDS